MGGVRHNTDNSRDNGAGGREGQRSRGSEGREEGGLAVLTASVLFRLCVQAGGMDMDSLQQMMAQMGGGMGR